MKLKFIDACIDMRKNNDFLSSDLAYFRQPFYIL